MQPRPASRTRAGAIADALLALQPPRRTVLFVSEDSDLRSTVTRMLERANYDVRAVPHSGHAVLLGRTTQFDVLIAALSGPDLPGPMLFDQLRRHSPGLTAVYFARTDTTDSNDVVISPAALEESLRRRHATNPRQSS